MGCLCCTLLKYLALRADDGNNSVFKSFRIFIFSSVLYSLYILLHYLAQ